MWTKTNLARVPNYFTYHYEHLDDLSFLRTPSEVFREHGYEENLSPWLQSISELLKKVGWEGDGELRLLWLPPFADIGIEDTWGTYVWVVKQNNNGESWIASHIELPYARLRAQNETRGVLNGMVPRSITRGDTDAFQKQVATERNAIVSDLASVTTGSQSALQRINEHSHARLVQIFFSYLDDCYLEVLQEVLIRGNPSGLKLRKAAVRLDPTDYLPESHDGDESSGSWFTLRGIVSDMWNAFKFEPFDQKAQMLFGPIDYKPESSLHFELRKHVHIRNAFQHHGGQLTPEMLGRLGRDRLILAGEQGKVTILPWKQIILSGKEVMAFAESLDRFATDFDSHIDKVVKSRMYIPL
ncbi:hypothetical protein [Myxococcus xanthus]|uniref:hypothetical protein n=1 Tax=Myxococcus xanthus TaxID=34 RepID=UPI00112A0F41|nr:hypothetical protein [Myxococcus xanthus]